MLLTKVTLNNYGVYRDKNEFNFECTQEKPIILCGGTNGAGKTTLFESIMLCLYGISFFDKRITRKEYEKYLGMKIHRYLGTPVSADHVFHLKVRLHLENIGSIRSIQARESRGYSFI